MENKLLFDVTTIANSINSVLNYIPGMIEDKRSTLSDSEKLIADVELEKLKSAKSDFFNQISKLQNIGK